MSGPSDLPPPSERGELIERAHSAAIAARADVATLLRELVDHLLSAEARAQAAEAEVQRLREALSLISIQNPLPCPTPKKKHEQNREHYLRMVLISLATQALAQPEASAFLTRRSKTGGET